LLDKIKTWQKSSNPSPEMDIDRCIHYLCLMADELEEKVNTKTSFKQESIEELEQKALYVANLARKLTSG